MKARTPIVATALLAALLGGSILSLAIADPYTLECTAEEYALGDSVLFRWTNNTDSSLVAGNTPPYLIFDVDTEENVYGGQLPLEYWLPPQSYVDLFWDQRDWEGNPVGPGEYRVEIGFTFNGNPPPGDVVEDWFEIVDPTPVRPGSWGRVRSLFR
jgi:hypothetical protein